MKTPPSKASHPAPSLAKQTPLTHDEYLALLPEAHRAALQTVRQAIQDAAPEAVECISYGLPAYRHNGKLLVFYGAATRHCALYAITSSVIAAHRADLKPYDLSGKGTIRFPADRPIPGEVVRQLIKALIAERRK